MRGWVRLFFGWALLVLAAQPGAVGVAAGAVAGRTDGRAIDLPADQLGAAEPSGAALLAPARDRDAPSGAEPAGGSKGLAAGGLQPAGAPRSLAPPPCPPRAADTGILESQRIPTGPPA